MKTVFAYRLIKNKWVDNAFTGDGAKLYGGRWNSKGNACVYLASSESLAILEIFVHIEDYSLLREYSLFQLVLPKSVIDYVSNEELPPCWQEHSAPPETAVIGDSWLHSNQGLALAVPSVIVPREWNYMLNPKHTAFNAVIKKANRLHFSPDTRLLQ
ncbi:RES family NAD+ phosphorylase [Facilibium subflavum]|uniref:RES family NAD+ phosphorylase n=1 Tax=Facilibium subflavum TaxID=2219058 RepID=UPI000E6475B3|nr:RES family NAD+ phosphorylase [Facilibium subflavum]